MRLASSVRSVCVIVLSSLVPLSATLIISYSIPDSVIAVVVRLSCSIRVLCPLSASSDDLAIPSLLLCLVFSLNLYLPLVHCSLPLSSLHLYYSTKTASCQEVLGNFFIYFIRQFAQKFFATAIYCGNYGLAACQRLADCVGVEAFPASISPGKQTIDFVFFSG